MGDDEMEIVFEVTNRCNLDCIWCGVKKKRHDLPKKTILKILDKYKPKVITLNGGEPLLHKDIFEIINYARSKNIKVFLNTNATLITKRIAKKINANYIRVSVDGITNVHDEIRGKGSFEKTLNGINNLREARKKVILATCLGQNNKESPLKIIKFFYPKIKRFMFGRVIPIGKANEKMKLTWLESFWIWLKLLPLRPFMRIYFSLQYGKIFNYAMVAPEILANGDVIPCCVQRGKIITNTKEILKNKKLKMTKCLMVCSTCEKCIKK